MKLQTWSAQLMLLTQEGLGGVDGAVVIDLKNIQQFSYNSSSQRATFGAGYLLQDLDNNLQLAGGRAISHGICPQVGVGGHATIGGLGPSSRLYGSLLDHIEEVEVVLANSSIVRASTTQNDDVFYAMMGAGASFGIVSEFVARTEAAPGEAVQYAFALTGKDAPTMASAFKSWQTLISSPDLPREFGSTVTVLGSEMVVSGTYFGSKEQFDSYNFSSVFPEASSNTTVFRDYSGLLLQWAEDDVLQLSGASTSFYAKGISIPQGASIPDDAIDTLFEYFASADKSLTWFAIFDLSGGAISDVPLEQTSFANRKTKFYLQPYIFGSTTQTPQIKTYLDGMVDIVRNSLPNLQLLGYPGYVDPDLPNPQQAYWGANLPRLEQIKAAIDPDDVFHNPQSVQPASA